ncbi:hypothetical protein DK843_22770 (plasmid) [Chromobacterium phragmitis]|uniref:Uncharacterized protein n=2 Tax=Chromobacterium phragmitis TaxID=2202141 RepID=A0A344UPH7_9NEIS|nr:hypothetical protein DK843_22770 [Chromobacterium phragmitis]
MALTGQQVELGIARFLEAYPAARREVDDLDEALATSIGMELTDLRQQHALELMDKTAKGRGVSTMVFMLEFALDTQEERSRFLEKLEEAHRRAVGL